MKEDIGPLSLWERVRVRAGEPGKMLRHLYEPTPPSPPAPLQRARESVPPSPPAPLPKGEGSLLPPSPPAPLPKGEGSLLPPSPPAPLPKGEGRYFLAAAAVIMLLFGMQGTAVAQRKEALPTQLEGVDVVEHPGVQIPLDLKFVDSRGKPVTLKELFDSGRPVVLTLNYSNCPMLCGLQLNGLFEALKKMKWSIGDQYDMITLSFDPLESTARARMTKEKYLKAYRRAGADEGWHFLTGKEENIKKLADTIGFHYRYSPETKQYYHVAVTFIVMPDGRVSRYLYGVAYDPQTIRLSLGRSRRRQSRLDRGPDSFVLLSI